MEEKCYCKITVETMQNGVADVRMYDGYAYALMVLKDDAGNVAAGMQAENSVECEQLVVCAINAAVKMHLSNGISKVETTGRILHAVQQGMLLAFDENKQAIHNQ